MNIKIIIQADVKANYVASDWEFTADEKLHHKPSGCVFQSQEGAMYLARIERGRMPDLREIVCAAHGAQMFLEDGFPVADEYYAPPLRKHCHHGRSKKMPHRPAAKWPAVLHDDDIPF